MKAKEVYDIAFPGGMLINASAWGMDDSLKIIFKEDGSIDYIEAIAALPDKSLYKYVDEDGNISPDAPQD